MARKIIAGRQAKSYKYADKDAAMRPEVGTQARFTKKLPPKTYHYDSSLSPALDYDGQNHARELGEWLLKQIEEASRLPAPHIFKERREFKTADGKAACSIAGLQDAVAALKALSKPFLNWAGKAERLSFDVPTLPLFVHERLSTKAILETLKGHKRDKQLDMLDLFGDPQHPIADQVLRAYEHRDKWVNRMILGDSLVVMNSLLRYESLGGQVQMIYMDPPYGVSFGSNFQPFVRKRDVGHGDDEDMTREPEMVQAYRDTWELRLHSYLTYLRDRLLLARDLLHPSGSIFVQIGDENVHHVRELLDSVFGEENFVAVINFKTMMPRESGEIESVYDYLCWYARDKSRLKYQNLFAAKVVGGESEFVFADASNDDGYRRLSSDEVQNFEETARQFSIFKRSDLTSSGYTPSCTFPIEFEGQTFVTKRGKSWRTTPEGVEVLKAKNRLFVLGKKLYYKMYLRDFGYRSLTNSWHDTIEFGARLYVVQTTATVIERCILMTTDPGDLVLDPTCGSGTTAYVAEQWGRRWITIDTSRVPLALARQRLLTATYPWYELQDEVRGPASGFVYKRKQNKRGEEVGGIVPHVTLKAIANNEPPEEEVLVDRPEENSSITRVTGAFCFEATLPVASDSEAREESGKQPEVKDDVSFADRMLEVLRRSPVIRLPGNKTINLKNIRPPAKTLSLSAEAMIDATANGKATLADALQESKEKNGQSLPLSQKPVAIVFGPENAAVSERLINEASREAYQKGYAHLYVIGFQIEPSARVLVEKNAEMGSIPATYVQATTDLTMGDLLKNMRSSQIFSICGMPEVKLIRLKTKKDDEGAKYQATLLGLDIFDPVTMDVHHKSGNDVPAWFLDTNYNALCFHVSQAFFPKTGAWESLKKALRAEYSESVWDHLAGNVSAPFELGKGQQIAVKVIDDRGNELMVVKGESEAEKE